MVHEIDDLMKINKKLFIIVFLLLPISLSLFAEQLTFLCSNFSPKDEVYARSQSIVDSFFQKYHNFFHITPFPTQQQDHHELCFFNPDIFNADSISFHQKVIASNIQAEDSLFYNLIPYKPVLIDSISIIFISITTPDFPVLYKKYSKDIFIEPAIFEQTKILCDVFKRFGFDHIIAINYLGDYLSKELLLKVSDLDLVIDYFSLDNTHHYMQEISHPKLINWDRRKEHFLLIKVTSEKDELFIKEVVEME